MGAITWIVLTSILGLTIPTVYILRRNKDASQTPTNSLVNVGDCKYKEGLCHDYVHCLITKVAQKHPEEIPYCYAVFMIGTTIKVPLWNRRDGNGPAGLCTYSHHVVMIYSKDKTSKVYDIDSKLRFPEEFDKYVQETIKGDPRIYFRVVPGDKYLQHFLSTDRRGILKKNSESFINVPSYLGITDDSGDDRIGKVYEDKATFYKLFTETKLTKDYN